MPTVWPCRYRHVFPRAYHGLALTLRSLFRIGIRWLDPLALSVAAGRRVLRIRLHEQKTRHGHRVGKPTVFGMCDVSLDRVAIECAFVLFVALFKTSRWFINISDVIYVFHVTFSMVRNSNAWLNKVGHAYSLSLAARLTRRCQRCVWVESVFWCGDIR